MSVQMLFLNLKAEFIFISYTQFSVSALFTGVQKPFSVDP
uniref:Uncharacterized protein n=1 Tax=Anguilla anguilla TaxID=7936 RepID=A0A0E9UJK1_ANGAN